MEADEIDWPDGWASAGDLAATFERQLRRELSWRHPLRWKRVRAIGHRLGSDDVLFEIVETPRRYAVVHLTWRRHAWSAEWPWTTLFDDLASWRASEETSGNE